MSIAVRQLTADDWRLYRRLRLEALRDAPDSFRTTHAEAAEREAADWEEMVRRGAEQPDVRTLLASVDEEPSGLTFCWVEDGIAGIAAMWVAPTARRLGVGTRLLDAALAFSRVRGATEARLWVTDGNVAAERCYSAAGFQPTGVTDLLREGSSLTVRELSLQL